MGCSPDQGNEFGLETSPKGLRQELTISPQELFASLQDDFVQLMEGVTRAVNEAPEGAWIAARGEKVRELTGEFRGKVFHKGFANKSGCSGSRFSPLPAKRARAGG